MKVFRIPFIGINFSIFHHGILNIWGEHVLYGTIWSFHLFPAKECWRWGRNNRSGTSELIKDFGIGPLFRIIRFKSFKKHK